MSQCTAVVFDMDGVLIDSEPVWDQVRRGMAADAGLVWPAQATTIMQGLSTQEWSGYLIDEVGLPGSADAVAQQVIDLLVERYRNDGLLVMPGAVDAIRRMAARPGGVVGLASSSPRQVIDAVLDSLGITDIFAATVSTEEVGVGKPAPDGYLAACRQLGVDPAQAVAVEDSTNGLLSAKAAGMALIGLPNPFNPPTPEAIGAADAVLSRLDELTVALVDTVLGATS